MREDTKNDCLKSNLRIPSLHLLTSLRLHLVFFTPLIFSDFIFSKSFLIFLKRCRRCRRCILYIFIIFLDKKISIYIV